MMIKRELYRHLRDDHDTKLGDFIDFFIIIIITLNILLIILDTFDLPDWYFTMSNNIEFLSIVVFTVEYLIRLWISDFNYPNLSKVKARLKHSVSFMAIVDLLAIIPFYIPLLLPIDLRILRVLRLVRLFRLFKINRYTKALSLIIVVFKNKSSQLLSSIMIVVLLIVISSVVMYNLEHPYQPSEFENIFSALWWSVATLTTVGTRIHPITIGGRIMAGLIALLGVGLIAVPTGIISAGFVEMIEETTKVNKNHSKAYSKRKNRLPKSRR